MRFDETVYHMFGPGLVHLTRERELSVFALFTSISAVWGAPGLGAYAAANRFQEALIAERRAAGLPGVAIAWRPWAEGGMASASARRALRAEP